VLDLFAAVKQRYLATDLATSFNGIAAGDAFPDWNRPYLQAVPMSEVPKGRTNYGRYGWTNFSVTVVADTFEQADALAKQVRSRLLDPPLQFASPDGDKLLQAEEGNLTYRQMDQYWTASVEFKAWLGRQPFSRSY
jgi:hypothetical protein